MVLLLLVLTAVFARVSPVYAAKDPTLLSTVMTIGLPPVVMPGDTGGSPVILADPLRFESGWGYRRKGLTEAAARQAMADPFLSSALDKGYDAGGAFLRLRNLLDKTVGGSLASLPDACSARLAIHDFAARLTGLVDVQNSSAPRAPRGQRGQRRASSVRNSHAGEVGYGDRPQSR